jgi:ATP-dependent Lon protease
MAKTKNEQTASTPKENGQNQLPKQVPLLPLRSDVVFPETVIPLVVGRDRSQKLIDDVLLGDKIVGLITQRHSETEDPQVDDLFPSLCIASILKMRKFPDGSTRIVAQGLARARLVELTQEDPYPVARVEVIEEVVHEGVELDALVHRVNTLFRRIAELTPQMPEDFQAAVLSTQNPSYLADLLAANLSFSVEEKHQLQAEGNVNTRLEKLSAFLNRQLEVLELSSKIQSDVGGEISKMQREHYLRQQLKAIQKELGEEEGASPELAEIGEKIDSLGLSEEAKKEAHRELGRLKQMHPSSAEYSVARTYLDWLLSLPWKQSSRDRLHIDRARKVLDKDHFDLEKIKERILEYLAVRKLKRDMRGPILCFAGPPGTGKTSLGRSIARALGRQFVRMSLGGIRDEAEIRGHRRTYVGALPGRIIQGIRKAGTNNPVVMLDEVDKLGADFRGDPSSALLEVLDPEQNFSFRDHYLDVDFDLSRVMFLCTANVQQTIPAPLLDRMEVLELPGYSEEEKLAIARTHLLPKQTKEHGLKRGQITVADAAVTRVIAEYTREAGLRNLERELATICRKVARRRAEGDRKPVTVDAADVAGYLGPPKFYRELAERTAVPGVATGLAWTPTGGEILFIEASSMPGKGGLHLTGSLGDVMKESAQAALSFIRSHAELLGVDAKFFEKADLHIHVPAGAIGKDGPSAGVAIFASLLSLLRKSPLPSDLAMTGEITLSGRVLPVGGVREKLLSARRAGIRRVIMPRRNEKDTLELPDEVKNDLELVYVEGIDEVVPLLLPAERRSTRAKSPADSPRPATSVAS